MKKRGGPSACDWSEISMILNMSMSKSVIHWVKCLKFVHLNLQQSCSFFQRATIPDKSENVTSAKFFMLKAFVHFYIFKSTVLLQIMRLYQ